VIYEDTKNDKALLITKDCITTRAFDASKKSWANGAEVRTYLQSWIDDLPTLSPYILGTRNYTRRSETSSDSDLGETIDKVFLLSEADVFGTFKGISSIVTSQEYSNGKGVVLPEKWRQTSKKEDWLLRTPYTTSGFGTKQCGIVDGSTNVVDGKSYTTACGIRPAMWVDTSKLTLF